MTTRAPRAYHGIPVRSARSRVALRVELGLCSLTVYAIQSPCGENASSEYSPKVRARSSESMGRDASTRSFARCATVRDGTPAARSNPRDSHRETARTETARTTFGTPRSDVTDCGPGSRGNSGSLLLGSGWVPVEPWFRRQSLGTSH